MVRSFQYLYMKDAARSWLGLMPVGLLVLAAALKVLDPSKFTGYLEQSHRFGTTEANLTLAMLIIAEFSTAILFLRKSTEIHGLAIALLLYVWFAIYNAVRLYTGATTACPCFGSFVAASPTVMLAIDGVATILLCASIGNLGLKKILSNIRSRTTLPERVLLLGSMATLAITAPTIGIRQLFGPVPEPELTFHSPSLLLKGSSGIFGSPTAKVQLVIFGDFQCPPCRRLLDDLDRLSPTHYHARWKHLPLSGIHPKAFGAAAIAEQAELDNTFKLTFAELTGQTTDLPKLPLKPPISNAALNNLKADIQDAKNLKITGTPTIFAVISNRVYRIRNSTELHALANFAARAASTTGK